MKIPISIICFILSITFLYLNFDLVLYDSNINPDINNYISNYNNENYSYDYGFEIYQSIIRDWLGFSFYNFWLLTLIVITVGYYINSLSIIQFPFFIINFIFLSKAFGTQVRFFLAAILFLTAINYTKKTFKYTLLIMSSIIHYGLMIPIILYCSTLFKKFKLTNIITIKYLLLFIMATIILNLSFEYLISLTRFKYYANSHYMEPKSLSSFLYVLLSTFMLFILIKKYECNNNKVLLFCFVLLLLIIGTSSISVLSGRLLLIYILFESLLAKVIYKYNHFIFLGMLTISFLKLIPLIIKTLV